MTLAHSYIQLYKLIRHITTCRQLSCPFSVISIPLRIEHHTEIQGSLNVYSSKKNAFLEREEELLSSLARLLTAGLQILNTGADLLFEENFNNFPFPLIDANLQEFFKFTKEIKMNYLDIDFRNYIEDHPETVQESLKLVKINKANLKTLELLNVDFDNFLINFPKTILSKKNFLTYKEIIIALQEGKKELIKKFVLKSSDGKVINSMIKLVLDSKTKKFMDHLLIAIITT